MNCFLGLDVRQVLGTLESTAIEACCADEEEEDEVDEVEEQPEEVDDDAKDVGTVKDDDRETVVTDVLARFPSDIRRKSNSWFAEEELVPDVSFSRISSSSASSARSSSVSVTKSNRASSSSLIAEAADRSSWSAVRWSFLTVVGLGATSMFVLNDEHLWLPTTVAVTPAVCATPEAAPLAWRRWSVKYVSSACRLKAAAAACPGGRSAARCRAERRAPWSRRATLWSARLGNSEPVARPMASVSRVSAVTVTDEVEVDGTITRVCCSCSDSSSCCCCCCCCCILHRRSNRSGLASGTHASRISPISLARRSKIPDLFQLILMSIAKWMRAGVLPVSRVFRVIHLCTILPNLIAHSHVFRRSIVNSWNNCSCSARNSNAKTGKRIHTHDAGGAKAPRRLLLLAAAGYCWWSHLVAGIRVKMGLSAGNGLQIQERVPCHSWPAWSPALRFDDAGPAARPWSYTIWRGPQRLACRDATRRDSETHGDIRSRTRACVRGIRKCKSQSRSRSQINSLTLCCTKFFCWTDLLNFSICGFWGLLIANRKLKFEKLKWRIKNCSIYNRFIWFLLKNSIIFKLFIYLLPIYPHLYVCICKIEIRI